MRTVYINLRGLFFVALILAVTISLTLLSLFILNLVINRGNEWVYAQHSSPIVLHQRSQERRTRNPKFRRPDSVLERSKENGVKVVSAVKAVAVVDPRPAGPPPPLRTKEQGSQNGQNEGSLKGEADENEEDALRREKVREMMRHAWNGYKRGAWGANELKPLKNASHSLDIFGGPHMLLTMVDAADTLWLMGEREEYERARDYIRDNFDISKASSPVSVFEVNIRHLGAFLALHALTGEEFYIAKAVSVADALLPAFDTPSGLAKSQVDVHTGRANNWHWAVGSILAEFGTLHLEFVRLSHITGNPLYANKIYRMRRILRRTAAGSHIKGLLPTDFDSDTGRTIGAHFTLGALGDSFYEYLLKAHLVFDDPIALRMYQDAANAIRQRMVFHSLHDNLTYVAELRGDNVEHKMGHLACFVPGMFALEANYLYRNASGEGTTAAESEKVMEVAEALAHTCHESYVRAEASQLGPEMFYFSSKAEGDGGQGAHDPANRDTRGGAVSDELTLRDATTNRQEAGYMLRPEAIESWFYLWRFTRKRKYKEWVWSAITAIDRHCRVANGFVGLNNVYRLESGYDDVQQSYFLAETLKYAYMTFADETLPLDKWVLNTEAHPLPRMVLATAWNLEDQSAEEMQGGK